MKKTVAILAVISFLCSCSQDGYFSGSDASFAAGEHYLVLLTTDLVPDCLNALEYALNYDYYGYYDKDNDQYISGGVSLRTVGAEWEVNSVKAIEGVKIKSTAINEWSLSWKGDYRPFPGDRNYDEKDRYVMEFTVTAEMISEASRNHFDWKVKLNATRKERKGYACTMATAPDLVYTTSTKSYIWDSCDGSATIGVTKDGNVIDFGRMDYMGQSHRYFRDLL